MNDDKPKKPMIILTGPTAAGKTAISIRLAKAVNGAIISADSMQVYKYMDIGSAKITPEEMQGVPHYLVDVLEPSEEFNVYLFQQLANKALDEIYEMGKIPILVGGTGFYIQALLYQIDFSQEGRKSDYRNKLEALAEEESAHAVHELLKDIDPVSYEEIHENNVKRTIRALEYYHENCRPISEHNREQRQKVSPFRFAYFVLTDERKRLYDRIDVRVDRMMERGLLSEVETLREKGYTRDMVSMQGLGYKELLDYLDGKCSLDEAVYVIKRETRHFAKRQLTWFRRERDCIWIRREQFEEDEDILKFMLETIKKAQICF